MNLYPDTSHYIQKTDSWWIKDLHIRLKTIKLLEENTGQKLHDIESVNDFLARTPKAQATEEKQTKWTSWKRLKLQFSHSVVSDSVTPWMAACQASLAIINFRGLLKLMSIESVMPSNHLIFCCPLLLLPSIFPSIRVFSNESVPHIRWPKHWSFSFSISPSNEYTGWTGWISLKSKGLSRVFSNTTVQKHQFSGAQLRISRDSFWVKRQPTEWEGIFTNQVSDKRLTARTYGELLKFYNNLIQK